MLVMATQVIMPQHFMKLASRIEDTINDSVNEEIVDLQHHLEMMNSTFLKEAGSA